MTARTSATVRDRLAVLAGMASFVAGFATAVALVSPPSWPVSPPADSRSAQTVPVLPPDLDGRCVTC